jgi:hypothetical protein
MVMQGIGHSTRCQSQDTQLEDTDGTHFRASLANWRTKVRRGVSEVWGTNELRAKGWNFVNEKDGQLTAALLFSAEPEVILMT